MLYYFNPGHEYAMINASPYYMAPANMVKMQRDLAYLSAWYADNKDAVLIEDNLPANFIQLLQQHNLNLPIGVTQNKLIATNNKYADVHCWGVSPQALNYIESINKKYHINLQLPKWDNKLITLSSRLFSKECLIYLVTKNKEIKEDIIPRYFDNLADIKTIVDESSVRLLAKAPYSSSGKGLLWLPEDGLTRTEEQILHGVLKKQGTISVERALNKVVDFALEFNIGNKETCSFTGYSLFNTNKKGGYECNYLGSQNNIINTLSSFIDLTLLNEIKLDLISFLDQNLRDIYRGCVGVDMMIYKEKDQYLLHPCVEINIRDNMGLLAYHIYQKYIATESEGYFYIDFFKDSNTLAEDHSIMKQKYPLVCNHGKIESGYMSLCPIGKDTQYRAYILII